MKKSLIKDVWLYLTGVALVALFWYTAYMLYDKSI